MERDRQEREQETRARQRQVERGRERERAQQDTRARERQAHEAEEVRNRFLRAFQNLDLPQPLSVEARRVQKMRREYKRMGIKPNF